MSKVILATAAALLTALSASAAESPSYLVTAMKDIVAPQAAVIWDVGNRGIDDDGKPDASKLTAQDWDALGKAASAVQQAATGLADTHPVLVGPPGTKLDNEGAPGVFTAKQVQGFIDRDPADFSKHARALTDIAQTLISAAATKDAKKLADASGELDQVCEACHTKFWYPQ
jgi:hypothetical protein